VVDGLRVKSKMSAGELRADECCSSRTEAHNLLRLTAEFD